MKHWQFVKAHMSYNLHNIHGLAHCAPVDHGRWHWQAHGLLRECWERIWATLDLWCNTTSPILVSEQKNPLNTPLPSQGKRSLWQFLVWSEHICWKVTGNCWDLSLPLFSCEEKTGIQQPSPLYGGFLGLQVASVAVSVNQNTWKPSCGDIF